MSEQEVNSLQTDGEVLAPQDAPQKAPGSKIYNQNLEIFRQSIDEDLEKGLHRYGFALFHSLPPDEMALRREELGLEPRTAYEHYNLGCAYAQRENLEKALVCWQKALELNPNLPEAIFNVALVLERQGDKQGASIRYRRYLELVHDTDELSEIESRLAPLES